MFRGEWLIFEICSILRDLENLSKSDSRFFMFGILGVGMKPRPVSLASADTLTWGGISVDVPGLFMDGYGYGGICRYSDKGGGRGGWTSLDYLWMVILTMGIH